MSVVRTTTNPGKNLSVIRMRRGDTQAQLAEKLEVKPMKVMRVERGETKLPGAWIDKLEKVYDLNDEERNALFEGSAYYNWKRIIFDTVSLKEEWQMLAKKFVLVLSRLSPEDMEEIEEILDRARKNPQYGTVEE